MPCRGAPEPSLPEDRAGPPLAPKLRGSCQPKWRHPVCRKTSDGCRRVARASKPQPLRGADNSLCCACSSSVPAGGAARGRRKKKKKDKKTSVTATFLFRAFWPCRFLLFGSRTFFQLLSPFSPRCEQHKGLPHPRGHSGPAALSAGVHPGNAHMWLSHHGRLWWEPFCGGKVGANV